MNTKGESRAEPHLLPSRRHIVWILSIVVGAAFFMFMEPEEFSKPVDEYSYALFNRIFSSVVYDAENSDTIGVVIADDDALRDMESSWPVPYGLHARVLEGIFYEQPLAVFLDFTLRDRRGPPSSATGTQKADSYPKNYVLDQSLSRLVRVLRKYRDEGIPVFITAAELKSWERHEVLAELSDYVTPVAGWGDAKSQSDVRGITYSLYPEKPNQDDSRNADQSHRKSAALTLYENLCLRRESLLASVKRNLEAFDQSVIRNIENWNCENVTGRVGPLQEAGITDEWYEYSRKRPMWLVWPEKQPTYEGWTQGTGDKDSNDDVKILHHPYRCPSDRKTDVSKMRQLGRNIGYVLGIEERSEVLCAPFDTISSAHVLFEAPQPRTYDEEATSSQPEPVRSWRSQFSGRVVMYGFNLQGFQDVIQPPTIDAGVAGVYLHAMALENLLTKGWGYLSDQTSAKDPMLADNFTLDIDKVEFLTLIAVFGFRLLVMWGMRRWWPVHPKQERSVKYVGLCEFLCRMLSSVVNTIRTIPSSLTDMESRQKLRRILFVLLLLLLDAVVVTGIVVFSAFWIEYHYFALAPANWLGILGLAFLTYPVFVVALFRDGMQKESISAGN
ncbi:hypothetical protein AUP42_20815 [Thalassospira lucentensis]|uniref:CHASE2 domain-containing protein n=1 Tax=Thalassospira lucentensis TaxID=168935 RepID=A0A154L3Z8_9PROT|nr:MULTISPECIES: CHASE2 domain-containing protein [Thalassospira]KZB63505.1 hypothetical protein AUP42_20815 [Thalassospira lucentensis]MCH2273099.1 CHASE2 domain-containing protein [Thalassospira sp.]